MIIYNCRMMESTKSYSIQVGSDALDGPVPMMYRSRPFGPFVVRCHYLRPLTAVITLSKEGSGIAMTTENSLAVSGS